MEYADFISKVIPAGFTRVERDDRLLDIFTDQTLEKGVELWERWTPTHVAIIRVRLPFTPRELTLYRLSRPTLEAKLTDNKPGKLTAHQASATGLAALSHL